MGPILEMPNREIVAAYGETKTIVFEDIIIPVCFRYGGTIYLVVYDKYNGGYYDNARVAIVDNSFSVSFYTIEEEHNTSLIDHSSIDTGLFTPGYNNGFIFQGKYHSNSGDVIYPTAISDFSFSPFFSSDAKICDWFCLSESEYLGIRLFNLNQEINSTILHIDYANTASYLGRVYWDLSWEHTHGSLPPLNIWNIVQGLGDDFSDSDRIDSITRINDSGRVFEYIVNVTHYNGDHASFILCFDSNTQIITCRKPS